MPKHLTIQLQPSGDYDRNTYGIVLRSETEHRFTGPGIHNPSFRHVLQIWTNKRAHGGSGRLRDPHGVLTDEPYTYLWTAVPSVISRQARELPPQGMALELGDVVDLQIHGYVLGTFQIRARRSYDPHLVLVDTASSASRQHYIETGDYLTPVEVAENA